MVNVGNIGLQKACLTNRISFHYPQNNNLLLIIASIELKGKNCYTIFPLSFRVGVPNPLSDDNKLRTPIYIKQPLLSNYIHIHLCNSC